MALGFAVAANVSLAQDGLPSTDQDSTATYPATYFADFDPHSVSDMLDRIPGINVARGGPGVVAARVVHGAPIAAAWARGETRY